MSLVGVPHVVYRTWRDESYKQMPNLVEADTITKMVLARYSSDWQHLVFDNIACQKFVETHFAAWPAIIWAYNTLNYGVMKADFWRYLVIYQNGGLYLDMKSSMTELPDFDFDSCDKAAVMAWHPQTLLFLKHGEFVNWMVMAPPKSEFLWQVVWQVVRNVKAVVNSRNTDFLNLVSRLGEQNPKASILCLTGPIMYTYVARTNSDLVELQNWQFLKCFEYDLVGMHEQTTKQASHYSKQIAPLVVENAGECPCW